MEDKTPLQKLTEQLYGHTGPNNWPYSQNLIFEPSGASRLASIVGWLMGLQQSGQEKLAEKLAEDIDKQLSWLANYGGTVEISVDDNKQVIMAPAYRVVLADDGTFGGFSVLWYKAIPHAAFIELAQSIDPDSYSRVGETDEFREALRVRWNVALDKAKKKLRIREDNDMSVWRSWEPTWMKEKRLHIETTHLAEHVAEENEGKSMYSCEKCNIGRYSFTYSQERVYYGLGWNGGLLYRGPGEGQTFSVTLDPLAGTEHFWSIHT